MVKPASDLGGPAQGAGPAARSSGRGVACDFCTEPNASFVYPTNQSVAVVRKGDVGRPLGAWAACMECHQLIQQDDRVELVHRAAVRMAKKQGIAYQHALSTAVAYHEQFFANRTGSPAPIAWGA